MLAAIEAGGTKFVCAVGDETGEIVDKVTIPTIIPSETMKEVIAFFKKYQVTAMGVGSFYRSILIKIVQATVASHLHLKLLGRTIQSCKN